MKRSALAFVTSIAVALTGKAAFAGGLEIPDNGTEALGRGGTFVAKADDPTAIYHNVGGLAQQRGTRILLNANVARSSLSFQREGVYPGDPKNPATPYAGQPYPLAENQGGMFMAPFLSVTSNLGLNGVTFALGTFAPPAIGSRVYPLTANGMPSPVRYDAVGGMSTIMLLHTAAVGFRVSDRLDIGVAFHAVQASIGTRMIAYISKIPSCKEKPETQACDARGEASTTGWSATGSVGALFRPGSGWAMGANVRGPVYLKTDGQAKLSPPTVLPAPIPDSGVLLELQLPWVFRTGVRKAFGEQAADPSLDEHARTRVLEKGDIELDVTYETWGSAMNPGPKVTLEKMGSLGRQELTSAKYYKDTFSVRAGGSVTTTSLGPPITLRAGAFYDASATNPEDTRLDADTLTKVAGTAGAGIRLGAVKLDVAYASVFDVPRTVSQGRFSYTDGPPLNQGAFQGHTHIASVGAVIELDMLLGHVPRPRLRPEADHVAARTDPTPPATEEPARAEAEHDAPVTTTTETTAAPQTETTAPRTTDGYRIASATNDPGKAPKKATPARAHRPARRAPRPVFR